MISLTWLSDIHAEFISDLELVHFAKQVDQHAAEAVLITGDLSNAQRLAQALATLAKNINIEKRIYFVLGNHDFYTGSFEKVRKTISAAQALFPNLTYITGCEVIPLTEKTALVGTDGWADGTAGLSRKTRVRLNDDSEIHDFAILPTDDDRFDLMFKLASDYTENLRSTLHNALESYPHVIVATHAPPFIEATWHAGKISGPDFLPFFSSPTLGRMIIEVASEFPNNRIDIRCGHTHSPGYFETGNIKCWTAGPIRYFYPRIEGIIKFA